jgi:hypothetical protein
VVGIGFVVAAAAENLHELDTTAVAVAQED